MTANYYIEQLKKCNNRVERGVIFDRMAEDDNITVEDFCEVYAWDIRLRYMPVRLERLTVRQTVGLLRKKKENEWLLVTVDGLTLNGYWCDFAGQY